MTFDPAIGEEIRKTRPAVIVSSDHANRHINRITVVPMTGSTGRLYPSEVIVEIDGRRSKAVADQIRTISKDRLGERMGSISSLAMIELERAIRTHLDLK